VALGSGPLGIAHPVGSDPVVPTAALLPMIGWDEAGHRLGCGAGFFDRTLASLARKSVAIGVSYELARMKTIQPQSWGIPMDWVVTERGTYRRDPEGLVLQDHPRPGQVAPIAESAGWDPDGGQRARPLQAVEAARVELVRPIDHAQRCCASFLRAPFCTQDTRLRGRHALSFHQYGPWLASPLCGIDRG